MNAEYQRLAYNRAVIAMLKQHLEDNYIEGGHNEIKELLCDTVPFNQRQVPNESFIEVISQLQATETALTNEMAQFEFRRRDAKPLAAPAAAASGPARKGGKPRAKSGSAG